MRKIGFYLLCGGLTAVLAGCETIPTGSGSAGGDSSRNEGKALFSAMQEAVTAAGEVVDQSLVLVQIQRERTSRTQAQLNTFTGVVLTPDGHILVAGIIKPDESDRIEAWIGDTEYVAQPIKADDALGMTILKIEPEDPLTPLNLSEGEDLSTGEWGVVVVPSGEITDFTKFTSLAFCRGEVAGRYRRYALDRLPHGSQGAPVVNLSSKIVGLIHRNEVLSLTDLHDDLKSFLDEATGVRSPDEDDKKKAWLGIMMMPINKEHAKSKGLPVSAIWATHVHNGGPAAKAGVRTGDLITGLNGKPLRLTGPRVSEYFVKSLRAKQGNPFSLSVIRNGKAMEVEGVYSNRPEPETLRAEDIGISVSSITDTDVAMNNLFVDSGVIVTSVHRGSPAATGRSFGRTLLLRNDVIIELAGKPTPTIDAFIDVLEGIRREQPAAILVKYLRGRVTGYEGINLKIGEQDNGGKS